VDYYEALWKLDTGKPARESVHMAKGGHERSLFPGVHLRSPCARRHRLFGELRPDPSIPDVPGLYHQLATLDIIPVAGWLLGFKKTEDPPWAVNFFSAPQVFLFYSRSSRGRGAFQRPLIERGPRI